MLENSYFYLLKNLHANGDVDIYTSMDLLFLWFWEPALIPKDILMAKRLSALCTSIYSAEIEFHIIYEYYISVCEHYFYTSAI